MTTCQIEGICKYDHMHTTMFAVSTFAFPFNIFIQKPISFLEPTQKLVLIEPTTALGTDKASYSTGYHYDMAQTHFQRHPDVV